MELGSARVNVIYQIRVLRQVLEYSLLIHEDLVDPSFIALIEYFDCNFSLNIVAATLVDG